VAGTDYARLGCVACGLAFAPTLNKNGLPRKNQADCCSKSCYVYQWTRRKNPDTPRPIPKNAEARDRLGIAKRKCVCCGDEYMPVNNNATMYCSRRCKAIAWRIKVGVQCATAAELREQDKQREERAARERHRRAAMLVGLALKKVARLKQYEQWRQEQERKRLERTCIECGKWFDDGNGLHAKLCSEKCKKKRQKSSEAYKANKRASRLARKALERARTVEVFDPHEVLERDGWKCQICGRKTPKKLRGTYKDNAPELDHIVALANGGEHSRANTQCACRACNARKCAGRAVGQMGLFV